MTEVPLPRPWKTQTFSLSAISVHIEKFQCVTGGYLCGLTPSYLPILSLLVPFWISGGFLVFHTKCSLDRQTPVSASPHFPFHILCFNFPWWLSLTVLWLFTIRLLPVTCKLSEQDHDCPLPVLSNLRQCPGHGRHLIDVSWLDVKINGTGMKEKVLQVMYLKSDNIGRNGKELQIVVSGLNLIIRMSVLGGTLKNNLCLLGLHLLECRREMCLLTLDL